MDDINGDCLGRQFDEGVGESLDRTVNVTFDYDIHFFERAEFDAAAHFIECQHFMGAQILFALQLFTLGGYFARFLLCSHYVELVTGLRSTVKTEQSGGLCRTYFLNTLSAFIEEGLYAAEVGSGQYDIALAECAVRHKYSGNVTTTFVKR